MPNEVHNCPNAWIIQQFGLAYKLGFLSHGLALYAPQGLYGTDIYDDRLSGPIWDNTGHPCANCKALIENMESSVANFDKFNGRQGAPA